MAKFHFVFKCPLRQRYALCVVDHQDRFYCSPGWAPGGCCEHTTSNGSSYRYFTVSDGGATSELFQIMAEELKDGEEFPPTPLPGHQYPDDFDWTEMWVPLGEHDGYDGREVSDDLYARWVNGCDLLFGSPGAHALVTRAAKARHKKQVAVKRRRDQKRGYHAWSDPWGRIVRVPIS